MYQPLTTAPPNLAHRRDSARQTNCDDKAILTCGATGTCYTGVDGFVGCCSTTNCVARTTCIEHNLLPYTSCDLNYGGCVPCTDSVLAHCVTVTNPLARQYAIYCDSIGTTITTAYENLFTTGSLAAQPTSSAASTTLARPAQTFSSTSSASSTAASSTAASSIAASSTAASSTAASSTAASSTAAVVRVTNSLVNEPGQVSHPLSNGAIAGISVASVAFVASLVVLAFAILLFRRRKRSDQIGHKSVAVDANHNGDSGVAYARPPVHDGPMPSEMSEVHATPRCYEADADTPSLLADGYRSRHSLHSPGPQYAFVDSAEKYDDREQADRRERPYSEVSALTSTTSPQVSPKRFPSGPAPHVSKSWGSLNNLARTLEEEEPLRRADTDAEAAETPANISPELPQVEHANSSHAAGSNRQASGYLSAEAAMQGGYRD